MMSGQCATVGRVPPATADHRAQARLTVARHARDADDLRHLLDVLALWPAQDAAAAQESTLVPSLRTRRCHPW